jgi:hypothetical protein
LVWAVSTHDAGLAIGLALTALIIASIVGTIAHSFWEIIIKPRRSGDRGIC